MQPIFNGLGDLGWLGLPPVSPAAGQAVAQASQDLPKHEISVLLIFEWFIGFLLIFISFIGTVL